MTKRIRFRTKKELDYIFGQSWEITYVRQAQYRQFPKRLYEKLGRSLDKDYYSNVDKAFMATVSLVYFYYDDLKIFNWMLNYEEFENTSLFTTINSFFQYVFNTKTIKQQTKIYTNAIVRTRIPDPMKISIETEINVPRRSML